MKEDGERWVGICQQMDPSITAPSIGLVAQAVVNGQFHEFVAFSAIFQNCSIATSSIRIKPLKSLLYGTS